ncbi:MAG: D-2-hydroxyacid dehydrogenase [Crocinitomicaceae bacterium]|jgi:D-3-phosphoglycerate dehydrogenase / 2-oxoglutarate reductase|nr:D-2-hydroxyacid dehydrogenase [Crocinitomicaceae bacterium]MDP4760762.1 D-2-hydroxyacid dehydrogenase [Crocinitomicaceae bacterium]
MKILANDGISPLGQQLLEAAGHQVITEKVAQEQLAAAVNEQGIDVVLVRSATTVRQEVIDACPGIKIIGRGGVGMDNIDVDYARSKGIHVINTPASSSQSVAELVMGQFFSLSRFLHDSFKNMETGDFSSLKKNYAKGVELRGKTLGIIGFGRIGQSLASYALGIGMNVIAIDNAKKDVSLSLKIGNKDLQITMTTEPDLQQFLGEMDYISIHVPKQKDGSAVIGANEFARMKKGVFMSNAARGGVVNEDALLNALNEGIVAGMALDVFENEPNPRKDLLNHPKIACTPHIGAATLEAQDRIGEELAQLIIGLA